MAILGYLALLELVQNLMENVKPGVWIFQKKKKKSTYSYRKHMLCERNHFVGVFPKNRNLSIIQWLERNTFRINLLSICRIWSLRIKSKRTYRISTELFWAASSSFITHIFCFAIILAMLPWKGLLYCQWNLNSCFKLVTFSIKSLLKILQNSINSLFLVKET